MVLYQMKRGWYKGQKDLSPVFSGWSSRSLGFTRKLWCVTFHHGEKKWRRSKQDVHLEKHNASTPFHFQHWVDGKLSSNAGPVVIYLQMSQYGHLTTWMQQLDESFPVPVCLSVIAKSVWSLSECLALTLNPSYLPHTHTQIPKTLREIGRGTKIFGPATGWSQWR